MKLVKIKDGYVNPEHVVSVRQELRSPYVEIALADGQRILIKDTTTPVVVDLLTR